MKLDKLYSPTVLIRENVLGAPFAIGARVRVVKLIDDTSDANYIGKRGTVIFYDYTSGVGQSFPDYPFIGVRMRRKGRTHITVFWKDELVPWPPTKQPAST